MALTGFDCVGNRAWTPERRRVCVPEESRTQIAPAGVAGVAGVPTAKFNSLIGDGLPSMLCFRLGRHVESK
jgi:hypothetical protein